MIQGQDNFRTATLALIVSALVIELATVTWLYWPGLHGPLVLDDSPQLSALMHLNPQAIAHWKSYLFSNSGPTGRPVAMATFLLNGLMAGSDVFAWKATNLSIHLLTGSIVIWLSALVFAAARGQDAISTTNWWAGLLVGGLWLLHPIQVSTVLYTVQRMAQLSALFCFGGMLCYLAGRRRQIKGLNGGSVLVAATYVVFLPLATYSKENGALLPAYTFLLEVFLLHWRGDRFSRRVINVTFAIFLVIPAAVLVFYFVVNIHAISNRLFDNQPFTMWQHLLTEQRVIVAYMAAILMPTVKRFGFFHDDFPVSLGWFHPVSTLGAFVLLCLIAGAAFSMWRKRPLVAFGVALFFVGHSMESTILPLELMFEHRNYLPSYGLLLAGCDLVASIGMRQSARFSVSVVVLLLYCAVLSSHVDKWSSDAKFASYVTRTHPRSPRVMAMVAGFLARQHRYQDAIRLLASESSQGALYQSLELQCRSAHELEGGALRGARLKLKYAADDYAANGLIEIARQGLDFNCKFDRRDYLELLDAVLKTGVRERVAKYKIEIYRAYYLWAVGDRDPAIKALSSVSAAQPRDPVPLCVLAEWSLSLGRVSDAKTYYGRAVEAANASGRDYRHLISEVGKMFGDPARAAQWPHGE